MGGTNVKMNITSDPVHVDIDQIWVIFFRFVSIANLKKKQSIVYETCA